MSKITNSLYLVNHVLLTEIILPQVQDSVHILAPLWQYFQLAFFSNRFGPYFQNFAEQQVSNEMAIHTDWLRAEDVDVITDQIDPNGAIYFKALVKPLVNFIWLAGLVFLAGSLIALWPDPREQRRLAARYALAKA